MHPAPVCSAAMVPDLHVPQMSLAFGEPSMCQRGAPDQTVLEPANDCWARLRPDQSSALPLQTSLYPGRPAGPPCAAPLRSSRVSSSSDVKDLSQPLFVDTTVEYDLPKAAYPPENSEPLLIVHPQYYEHLRHRRTLGAGCACQLCNFYGRRIPHGGQGAVASVPTAVTAPAAPVVSMASSAAAATAGHHQTFQKPEAPRHHWPRHFPQPHQHQHPLLQQHQAVQHQLAAQQQQAQQQQQQQAQQQQQQQQQAQQQQQLAQQPRYNCMLERQQRRDASCAGAFVTPSVSCAGAFVTPSVSCDSDSGYSSVELEAPEWCQRGRQQQPLRAECDVRDVLAKRKRRVDAVVSAADHAAASAAKRLRVNYWPGCVPALDMAPYLHRQPAVM